MANPVLDRLFGAFNPLANDRPNGNPAIPPQPQQPPTFGPNPFNRPNRPAGANPPFVFNPQPREPPRWNLRRDGQWGLNVNPARQPNRVAAYDADEEYVRFQARAFGVPQEPPQEPPQGPGVAPQPVNGAAPPPPPPAPAPAPPPPQAPPAQEGGAQPVQNQAAGPPVILLGRRGNAGTGREVEVAPMVALQNLGRDLLSYLSAAAVAVVGFISTALLAVYEVARPLTHFAARWAIFFILAAVTTWASMPTVLRVLLTVHRAVAVLLSTLVEVLIWAFNLNVRWPRAGSLVGYTLRPEYASRAVTGMAFLETGVCPIGGGIQGPPYGATALSSADLTPFSLPYPFSLPPIRFVWTVLWSLLIALVSAVSWAAGAALAIDLQVFPSEADDNEQ